MALYIKDRGVAELARELARKRHRTVTDIVREALERESARLRDDEAARQAKLKSIQARVRASWKGPLTSDHSFLYDADGNPVL